MNARRLTLLSGIGLVVADMAGVGVLTTSGFMAGQLSTSTILVGWLIGGLLALSGAVAYGALARTIAKSGGEYRYLSELLHPAIGTVAGLTSFLVGFSAPVAMAAYAAGAFAEAVNPALSARTVGSFLVIGACAMHASKSRWSVLSQDALAALKGVLLVGFVVLGVAVGGTHTHAPAATVLHGTAQLPVFMVSLVYIAFAYSGWNAAIYASGEFKNPERDVPRAMIYGTLIVIALYLCVNAVFLANLEPERMAAWARGDTQRVTLAHLIVQDWLGPVGADLMSAMVVTVLASSVSVMTLTGPRVYSSMARDGFLPKAFAGQTDHPPRLAIFAQGALSLALLYMQTFEDLIHNVGAVLTATTALTAVAVFRVRLDPSRFGFKPSNLQLFCAGIYIVMSCGILYFTVSRSPGGLLWATLASTAMVGYYFLVKRFNAKASRLASS